MDAPTPPRGEARAPEPKAVDRCPPIRIEGLHKFFRGHLGLGKKTAVESLDLEVGRGQIYGLLGPNGAGKTTTLKMLLGLLRPDGGSVQLFGMPPSSPEARARLGYLPENPYFYDYLTGAEFLDFYGRLQGLEPSTRKQIVDATLRRVGLDPDNPTALRKYSKGMTQRLGLAQAIQHSPELVILDEPMSGLDPVVRREVRDLILSLRTEGKTVFFSSHILQDAEMICDHVAILVGGRLKATGRLDEMISQDIQWFEVSARGVDPASVPGQVLSRSGGNVLFRVEDVAGLTGLLNAIEQQGGQVAAVFPRRETLEDLFLRKVAETRPEEKR